MLNRRRSGAFIRFVLSISVATAALGADVPPGRVDEIATMLGAAPSGLGRPISDRAVWQELDGEPAYQQLVQRAEKLLDQPLPEQPEELFLDFSKTGQRRPWERVAFSRRGRIMTLVLAECVENQGRFLPAFEGLVAALSAEPTWVYPAHDRSLRNFRGEGIDIDLGSSFVAAELALAHYLLGDTLSPTTRDYIEREVRRRVLDPFAAMVRGERDKNWWLTGTNNWNSVCLAGVTTAALALVEDKAERACYIAAAEHYSKNFLNGFTADGYCSEGLGYWNYGFGRYAMLSEAVRRATRGQLDLLAVDAARLPARFGRRVEIVGGVYPTFADCPMRTKPSEALLTYLDRVLGGKQDNAPARVSPHGGLLAVLSFTPWPGDPPPARLTAAAPAASDLRTWFDEAGVLICRPAQQAGPGRLGVALKGGHNAEHHNHNDVGTFIVVVDDQPVLVDPGTEVYTARTFSTRRYESNVLNSFGHPVPRVAGQLQKTGKQAHGEIVQREFTDLADTIGFDLRSAYDVPTLERLERRFRFQRDARGGLSVTDTVAFTEPQEFELALITFGEWSQPAIDRLRVTYKDRAVDVVINTGGPRFAVTSELIDEEVRIGEQPTRIAIRLAEPVRAAEVTMLISAADTDPGH